MTWPASWAASVNSLVHFSTGRSTITSGKKTRAFSSGIPIMRLGVTNPSLPSGAPSMPVEAIIRSATEVTHPNREDASAAARYAR
jgi:hypothetical protein